MKYPSQQNRKPINIDAKKHAEFKAWCIANGVDMKNTIEALIDMCLEGELVIAGIERKTNVDITRQPNNAGGADRQSPR